MYGPAFELQEYQAVAPGREEYLHSGKYEVRTRDVDRADSFREYIAIVNRIRHDNPALQSNDHLQFHPVDNDQLIAYSKTTPDGSNIILTVVNLDPHHTQSGWVDLQIHDLGIEPDQQYQVHDLLGGGRYLWQGYRNFVQLNPSALPGHIFHVLRRMKTEQDFDYFM
jgi:starch synthase (maltosyl-transferring)